MHYASGADRSSRATGPSRRRAPSPSPCLGGSVLSTPLPFLVCACSHPSPTRVSLVHPGIPCTMTLHARLPHRHFPHPSFLICPCLLASHIPMQMPPDTPLPPCCISTHHPPTITSHHTHSNHVRTHADLTASPPCLPRLHQPTGMPFSTR